MSTPFTITAHRFADAYEFDDGNLSRFHYPNGTTDSFPTSNIIDNTYSNTFELGVVQNNHNFHSPATYDANNDIDTIQLATNSFPIDKELSVTVFNMASGLDVGVSFECAGVTIVDSEPKESVVGYGSNNPIISTVINQQTGAKTVRFFVREETWTNGLHYRCMFNRIVFSRLSGTPSENLTYSVVVNDAGVNTQPQLNSASAVCNNNYCIRLLGENFDANSYVRIRENISGGATLKTIAGNDIYSRNPHNGLDQIFFPFQDLNLQDKFNNNGLCFTVVNVDSSVSNEKCFVRPVTLPQGLFMGKTVESYAGQDIEPSSYVVVGNANKLKIWGNSWKKIAYNYNVTANTVLEFKFRATQQEPEITGIGFIMNGQSAMNNNRAWKVFGTQNAFNQTYDNYASNPWKTYRIPIGETFTGQISHMVFFSDEDNHVGQNVVFKNPKLIQAPDQYDDVPYRRAFDDDVRERPVYWIAADSGQLHNFHDAGDADWTIVYTTHSKRFRTQMIGNNSDTKMSVYKWISATANSDGTFRNISDQLLATDDLSGNSSIVIANDTGTTFAVKVESRNNQFGAGTEYKLIIENDDAIVPDEFDNVPIQTTKDDDAEEHPALWVASDNEQEHNFHDAGDVDWTIIVATGDKRFRTELVGTNADTRMTVYKWINASSNGDDTFYNINHRFVALDSRVGASEVSIYGAQQDVYAIKVESRNGVFGEDTDYKLIIDTPPSISPDQYDNVPSQTSFDDDVREQPAFWTGEETEHYHNFHDSGDVDWTIVVAGGARTIRTEMIGRNSDTKMTVYKWTGATDNFDGTFSNIVDEYVATDNNSGNSSISVNPSVTTVYAIKVESRIGASGAGTQYKIIIE